MQWRESYPHVAMRTIVIIFLAEETVAETAVAREIAPAHLDRQAHPVADGE